MNILWSTFFHVPQFVRKHRMRINKSAFFLFLPQFFCLFEIHFKSLWVDYHPIIFFCLLEADNSVLLFLDNLSWISEMRIAASLSHYFGTMSTVIIFVKIREDVPLTKTHIKIYRIEETEALFVLFYLFSSYIFQ